MSLKNISYEGSNRNDPTPVAHLDNIASRKESVSQQELIPRIQDAATELSNQGIASNRVSLLLTAMELTQESYVVVPHEKPLTDATTPEVGKKFAEHCETLPQCTNINALLAYFDTLDLLLADEDGLYQLLWLPSHEWVCCVHLARALREDHAAQLSAEALRLLDLCLDSAEPSATGE